MAKIGHLRGGADGDCSNTVGAIHFEAEIQRRQTQLPPPQLSVHATPKPVVALGDFNAAHLDADIWNLNIASYVPTSAGTTPKERESFGKLLEDAKLVDVLRRDVGPDALGHFSYWSQRAKNKPKNRGLRLDYTLVSEEIEKNALYSWMLTDMTAQWGDHCPVGLRMKF